MHLCISAYWCIRVSVYQRLSNIKEGHSRHMENFETCSEYLDSIGVDVLEVGCKWHERSPATLADNLGAVAGLIFMMASAVLLLKLNDLANRHFS